MTNDVPAGKMRLQKYLARCGIASRRASEDLITAGRVSVNGCVVTELGTKVDPDSDGVCVDGTAVTLGSGDVTLMLHKPAGYVSTMDDPQHRATVRELVPISDHPSLFHIGRLDRDTSGLLLFTTDGMLGNALLHPSHEVEKVYYACIEGALGEDERMQLEAGVMIDGRKTAPSTVSVLGGDAAVQAAAIIDMDAAGGSGHMQAHAGRRAYEARKRCTTVKIAIHEGRNRQVRRMFEAVGHPVIALHRESIGGLHLDGLERGRWRYLTEEEIASLKAAALR